MTEQYSRPSDNAAPRPPWWVRYRWPMIAPLVAEMFDQRGWGFGLLAVVAWGVIVLATSIGSKGKVTWSKGHPILDGSVLGPALFLAFVNTTDLPWWVCLLPGVVGALVGGSLGARRGRRLSDRACVGARDARTSQVPS